MWCCPGLKRKLIVAGGQKKKKTVWKKMGLGWIFKKFCNNASLKPFQEVGKIQKVGKKNCETQVLEEPGDLSRISSLRNFSTV